MKFCRNVHASYNTWTNSVSQVHEVIYLFVLNLRTRKYEWLKIIFSDKLLPPYIIFWNLLKKIKNVIFRVSVRIYWLLQKCVIFVCVCVHDLNQVLLTSRIGVIFQNFYLLLSYMGITKRKPLKFTKQRFLATFFYLSL